jgi:hypothetical protein
MTKPNLTQSPRAIREGKDPNNVDGSKVQLGMDTPGKNDYANSGDSDPWQHQGEKATNQPDV